MHRTRLLAASVIGAFVVLLVGASLQSAHAKPSPRPTKSGTKVGQPTPGGLQGGVKSAPSILSTAGYKKYVVATSGPLSDTAGAQTLGTATCAKGVVAGGGVFVNGGLGEDVNSSWPSDSKSWSAYVSNRTGAAGSFQVYAICVKSIAKYQVVSADFANPAGAQSFGSAACPTKTSILGGGTYSTTPSTSVNLNSTWPDGNGWSTFINNASPSDAGATVYAICGKAPGGYSVVPGSTVTQGANGQTGAGVGCPSGTKPIGGGAFSSSGSTAVNLNTTYPGPTGWGVYENNETTGNPTIQAHVICAQAS